MPRCVSRTWGARLPCRLLAVESDGHCVGFRILERCRLRSIEVDRARRRKRLKRGGGGGRVELLEADLVTDSDAEEVLAVSEALDRLVTYYLVFVMELKARRVCFAGCTHSPKGAMIKQIARQLTDAEDGFPNGKRYLILARDTKFCDSFRSSLKREGIKPVVLPPRSPNLSSHLARFFGSLKRECVSKVIFFGPQLLTNAVNQYLEHYHAERNHQGLDNSLIEPREEVGSPVGEIQCRERLGGMLKHYHRSAA